MPGPTGLTGADGIQGPAGEVGPMGPAGADGLPGPVGPAGADGLQGPAGPAGADGLPGPTGADGLQGPTGPNTFNLAEPGVYQVLFQVSINESGQLVLTLNSGAGATALPYTVTGRTTGTSQIVGMALVQTTIINSVLTVRNPVSNATPLTVTPSAGGTSPVSAHLVITKLV